MTAHVEVSLTIIAPTLADAQREAFARLDKVVPGAEWHLSYDATIDTIHVEAMEGAGLSYAPDAEWRIHAHLQGGEASW